MSYEEGLVETRNRMTRRVRPNGAALDNLLAISN
jgi:hypothetical protein